VKPEWLKIHRPAGKTIQTYYSVQHTIQKKKLNTVCEEAKCPNLNECWSSGTATFMLMGDTCTRGCRFCSIKTAEKPAPLNPKEPQNLVESISNLKLNYVVLTSVDRDDLSDFGAEHFKKCVLAVKKSFREIKVELLIPDFNGNTNCLQKIIESRAEVIGHNIETVKRLQGKVRDRRANYKQSLAVLDFIKKNSDAFTKSSLMLGLGETDKEILQTMDDLRKIDVDFLTLGQYLQPTKKQLEVIEFIHPEKFNYYAEKAKEKGFLYVASGPFVRSSYKAGELFVKNILERKNENRNCFGKAEKI